MQDFKGKTAVVTGAGSGIGRSLATTFASEGMNVVVVDIEAGPANETAALVRALGVKALALTCDVSNRQQVYALADRAFSEFGSVNLLCNNAGVVRFAPLSCYTDADWDWTVGVNLYGVIHGVQAFLPRLLAQGSEAHIVNTASISGLVPEFVNGLGAYTTTKYGVVAISETLHQELAGTNVGISVLCPGSVATNIGSSTRNRPAELGGFDPAKNAPTRRAGAPPSGREIQPAEAAWLVLQGVRGRHLYILTDPAARGWVEERFEHILADFDWVASLQPEAAKAGGRA